jgi:hypothetical protein
MERSRWPWMAGTLALVAAGLVWSMWPDPPAQPMAQAQPPAREQSELLHPVRPSTPPVPGRDRPASAPSPGAPEGLDKIKDQAYAKAIEDGVADPGEVAFREMIEAFMVYNQAFAEAQAREEGITVAEVHELTYFGFKVLETQRWGDVAELVEHPITDEVKAQAEQLMHESNADFKGELRQLVDDGASEEERWALIGDTQARYMSKYFEITGMNEGLVDELLAGDPSRSFAPADTPPPPLEEIEPAPPPPPVEPRPTDG